MYFPQNILHHLLLLNNSSSLVCLTLLTIGLIFSVQDQIQYSKYMSLLASPHPTWMKPLPCPDSLKCLAFLIEKEHRLFVIVTFTVPERLTNCNVVEHIIKLQQREQSHSSKNSQGSFSTSRKSLSHQHLLCCLYISVGSRHPRKVLKRAFENFPTFLFMVSTSHKWSVLLWNNYRLLSSSIFTLHGRK